MLCTSCFDEDFFLTFKGNYGDFFPILRGGGVSCHFPEYVLENYSFFNEHEFTIQHLPMCLAGGISPFRTIVV